MLRTIKEKAPPKGWRPGAEHSFSKLWIKFGEGQKSFVFWSLDWRGSKSGLRSQALGLARLEALMLSPAYKDHAVAIIYDRETKEKLLVSHQGVITERKYR